MRRILIVVGSVVLLAVFALVVTRTLGGSPTPTPEPTPTPTPELRAEATDLRTFPETSESTLAQTSEGLKAFLEDAYSRAFLPPFPPPTPGPDDPSSPAPTPVPRPSLAHLLTDDARTALQASPEAFRTDHGGVIFEGNVRFKGVVSLVDDSPRDALLEILFQATGRMREPVEGSPDPDGDDDRGFRDLRLTQKGRLHLVRLDAGWRISDFDLELREEIEVPRTPAPAALQPFSTSQGSGPG